MAMMLWRNNRNPIDRLIREHITFIAAARRKFRHHRAAGIRLKPVKSIGRYCVLPARLKDLFVPDGVRMLTINRRSALCSVATARSFDVQKHSAPTTAKRFLFARLACDRRMTMLGARLVWKENKLFGTDAFGIYIRDELQAGAFKFTQTEVCNLDVLCFFSSNNETGLREILASSRTCGFNFLLRQHQSLLGSIEASRNLRCSSDYGKAGRQHLRSLRVSTGSKSRLFTTDGNTKFSGFKDAFAAIIN